MDFQQVALTVCGATVTYILYKWHHKPAINDILGPKNPSWIHGHNWWWQHEEAFGVVEKRILEEYGAIARWNGTLGESRLWVADPKAIHHILQGSSYLYPKPPNFNELLAVVIGGGVATVEGDVHKRHRKALAPAFGLVESKALYPHFARCSNSLANKWHETISNTEFGQAAIVDVHSWLSKATLDVIGTGAFNYDFGALENTDNKLTKSYMNLIFTSFGMPSKKYLFAMDMLKFAPSGFTTWIFENIKSPRTAKTQENKAYGHEVAVELIEDKKRELKDGTSQGDAMSVLVKTNSSLRPDWRLNDEEIVGQVRTIMFAGHDTTAKSMTMLLWELAKNRPVQERLRTEIMDTLGRIRTRGDSDFTVDDFNSMPYLLAVTKEILRVYPVALEITRAAKDDNVLPLSKPVVGVSGKVYNELPILAGTIISVSTVGYNLNKDIWGPDAYEFRPERWFNMNEKPELPIGVYGNLLSFSSGPRNCIGWRFAITEMHTFLVTLIKQFDFSLPENGQEIWMMRPGTLIPVVVGEEHKGPQAPLKVTALRNG